jgi:hypothetical protein
MLVINFLIHPLFLLQVLDLFSFLSGYFTYFNYYSAFLPDVLDVFFIAGIIYQWYTWVILPRRIYKKKVEVGYRIGFFLLVTVVLVYVSIQLVPFFEDLPTVASGEYSTYSISEADDMAMIYGQIILNNPDRGDVADTLRAELRDKYGLEYPDDNFPTPYQTTRKSVFGLVHLFYIKPEGKYYELNSMQFKATDYSDTVYPIVIKYLPHSKVILQITNG